MRKARFGRAWLGVIAVAVTLGGASASAAPTAANLQIGILVGPAPATRQPPVTPNGGTVTVAGLHFTAGFIVSSLGPDPSTSKARIDLPSGLRWGADYPDSSEKCTSDATSGTCDATLGTGFDAWGWDVIADAAGRYTLTAQIVESSTSDPDASDNASTVTVVVTQATGGGSGGGSGGSSGSAAVAASAVKVSPAKAKAGSRVVASVRVTKGGSPVKPTGVVCAATIGKTKVKGGGKSSSGVASCLFKTPKSGKGKKMLGSVSFKAGGQSFAKRFSVRLR
jgi:hypothetical protein